MRYQVTYWDTLEHVVQLYDSDNLEDCFTEYKRLLENWEHEGHYDRDWETHQ